MKSTYDDKYEITNEQIKELMTYNKKVTDTAKNMQKTNNLITAMDDYNAVVETLFIIVQKVKKKRHCLMAMSFKNKDKFLLYIIFIL